MTALNMQAKTVAIVLLAMVTTECNAKVFSPRAMPLSFKLLTMTAISTWATLAHAQSSLFTCYHQGSSGPDSWDGSWVLQGSPSRGIAGGRYTTLLEMEATITGDYCTAGQQFNVDISNTDPGIGGFPCDCYEVPGVCGDGKRVGPEACDDSNTEGGDGCASDCTAVETGFVCSGGDASTEDTCVAVCGDGKRVGPEVCDDSNRDGDDGCASDCTTVELGFSCSGGDASTEDTCQFVYCGTGTVYDYAVKRCAVDTNDIADLKTSAATTSADLADLKNSTATDIADLKTSTANGIADLKTSTATDIADLKNSTAKATEIAELKASTSTMSTKIEGLEATINSLMNLVKGLQDQTGDVDLVVQQISDKQDCKAKTGNRRGSRAMPPVSDP